ncbi:inorganic phosphate transporter [Haloflavibacter putidus]|uniref:Phosphate transporter n=1 Tax=Haloflavibacter putidus TaxID=2576776 RepID=A0A508A1D6_9FLAO|nr:inorganic phosphate transporter [Haloflavibacter putidus]TQD39642.1 inorganic phosphate transporter [Haloflavibacter putidus]
MENFYLVMLVILFALAITDLVVGVSNDAVNFLNSAIGSKAISFKTILIIASLGVAIGAIFSSGLMEVARKGIFMPGEFYFDEIMIIFMAVMVSDVLLLDFFNSLGLPTSTTVSIVFELLGAAVSVAVLKLYTTSQDLSLLSQYINTSKATEIVIGILLSVVIAFSIGAIVQYASRFVFSFQFEKKIKYVGAVFGGVSLAAITYFIFIKGLKSVSFISTEDIDYIRNNTWVILAISFVFWTIVSQLIMSLFKVHILRAIIVVGTFALALAFAGNDLVNFIGVPIAAWQSFDLWMASGVAPSELKMTGLSGAVPTPELLLIGAGLVMVVTLWFSSKAKTVVDTGVNLARQGDGAEKFKPNNLSRVLVRYFVISSNVITSILPQRFKKKIETKFNKPNELLQDRRIDAPAFDMVRASVNLVVASILISIGTNMKLPLSTTYVTFMVAMGSSLSDRAWDRESAVYRVSGVVNVIGGWFVTALVAFTAAAIFAAVIWFGGMIAIVILVILAVVLIVRSAMIHNRKMKEEKAKKRFNRKDIISINEITSETSQNISGVIKNVNKRYSKIINHLGYHDLGKLKKDRKKLSKLEDDVDELKDNVFYFIKSLEENSVKASKFYILFLDHLQDMVQSISQISNASYRHVNNNHKNLKFNQIRDLKSVDREMQLLFDQIIETFDNQSFENIDKILDDKQLLLDKVSNLIQKQIDRIRTSETSPKNSKLYFSLLLETKDFIVSTMSLLQLFQDYYENAKRQF